LIELQVQLKNAIDATSDLVADSFGGTAKTTQNAIDELSDLVVNSSGGTTNAAQNTIDATSDSTQTSLVELLKQLKTQLMNFLI
jgi:hypothetical protein